MYQFFRARLALVLVMVLVAAGASSVKAYELSEDPSAPSDQSQPSPADTSAGNALWSVPSSETTDIAAWVPQKGDVFEVNVQTNIGHLYHPDGTTLEFEVVSGVRRVVRYIGMRYFAATPATSWVAQNMQIKKDRMTFGKSGRFIRLFKNGVTSTAYGIHSFGREDSMFKVPGRYGSMGCIIVRESVMDLIEKTLEVNEGKLPVRTFPDMPKE